MFRKSIILVGVLTLLSMNSAIADSSFLIVGAHPCLKLREGVQAIVCVKEVSDGVEIVRSLELRTTKNSLEVNSNETYEDVDPTLLKRGLYNIINNGGISNHLRGLLHRTASKIADLPVSDPTLKLYARDLAEKISRE